MRLGEKLYHQKRTVSDGIVTFSEPYEYVTRFNYITVQPSRVALNNMAGFFTTEEYGEHDALAWNIICNEKIFRNEFSVGDLLYLDGRTVEEGANAVVTTVRVQNVGIYITAKQIEGE